MDVWVCMLRVSKGGRNGACDGQVGKMSDTHQLKVCFYVCHGRCGQVHKLKCRVSKGLQN